ncbi:GPW/gp25 family protein [Bradyrhizobium japonicum]|uniref:GPW/gp25 family protein n=1 Tax=Bradyrhizobium japonicum TaxID=375 RepID=UPI001BAE15B4|nr:GPW/gp25 family protein [Bradyrhizobium japonicum]MBR0748768.1 GPW/gp25 family protein [Bradyrhizobium japonicum]
MAISGWLFDGLGRTGDGGAIGAGPTLKPSGAIAMIEGDAVVKQAIMMLLSTSPGERVMRPDYGCALNRLVFEPNDATTAGLAIHYVRQALIRWEPRIEILRIDTRSGSNGDRSDDGHNLYLDLYYRVRASRQMQQITMNIDLEGDR